MSFQYKSIQAECIGVYKDKSSKFIAYLFPINNQEDLLERIHLLKKEHPQARHFCYAYRIGFPTDNTKSSDDGEPSGTAGKPILNQLLSNELRNVGAVVVRYFGGTLLGSSGLIKAYKASTLEAIAAAKMIIVEPNIFIKLEFGFDQLNPLMQFLKSEELEIIEKNIDRICIIKIKVPISKQQQCVQKLEQEKIKYFEVNKA